MMRRVAIEDLLADGAELSSDQLARISGGLFKVNPGPAPTQDTYSGTLDAPGSQDQTNTWHPGSDF